MRRTAMTAIVVGLVTTVASWGATSALAAPAMDWDDGSIRRGTAMADLKLSNEGVHSSFIDDRRIAFDDDDGTNDGPGEGVSECPGECALHWTPETLLAEWDFAGDERTSPFRSGVPEGMLVLPDINDAERAPVAYTIDRWHAVGSEHSIADGIDFSDLIGNAGVAWEHSFPATPSLGVSSDIHRLGSASFFSAGFQSEEDPPLSVAAPGVLAIFGIGLLALGRLARRRND